MEPSAPTSIQWPVSKRSPLLPPEMRWVYPLAPLAFGAIMLQHLEAPTLAQFSEALVGVYTPFVALTIFFEVAYGLVLPPVLERLARPAARFGVHALVIVGGSLGVGELIRPFHNTCTGSATGEAQFAVATVLISTIMVVPALLIQRYRLRVHAMEAVAVAQRQAALKAQLAALQARTNPHFFFNAVNTVASLIPDDPALAERTLERLAELFRYALEAGKVASVPLRREFEMATDYLAIQQARFGDALCTSVTLDPSVADVEVPPLVLQPLVENAILHGLKNRSAGRVDLSARRQGETVVIEVRDDGPGPGASEHQGTQSSMRELGDRLRLFFGEPGRVAVAGAPGGGCLVTLAVPMERK